MYIRHAVYVDQSADSVRRELLEPPERWLPPSLAERIGERQYLARVGFSAPGTRISKQVELTLGQPEAVGHWLVIPVAWRATGPSQLFPVLDAKLTVEPLGTHSSKLWLGGTYEPPMGGLGREIDAAVMHNVAEATSRTSLRTSRRGSRSSQRTGLPDLGRIVKEMAAVDPSGEGESVDKTRRRQQTPTYLDHAPSAVVLVQAGTRGASSVMPEETAEAVRAVTGVASAVPIVSKYAVLDLGRTKQCVSVVGYDPALGRGAARRAVARV